MIASGGNAKERLFVEYTNNGRKYLPATLENYVKMMKKKRGAGEETTFPSMGALRAKLTPKFKNITEVKSERNRVVDREKFEEVKNQVNLDYEDLLSDLSKKLPEKTDWRTSEELFEDLILNKLGSHPYSKPFEPYIDDAIKTTGLAQIFGLNVDLGILNKYLPENVGTYFSKWIEEQEKYVRQFETSLYPIPIKKLPIFEIELKGFEMLRKAAKILYENEDPSKVFHKGKIMEIRDIGDKYILEMHLPNFVNDCKDIILHGDELIIVLETDRGVIDKILPLPTILRTAKPETAYLEGKKLVVEFRKQFY